MKSQIQSLLVPLFKRWMWHLASNWVIFCFVSVQLSGLQAGDDLWINSAGAAWDDSSNWLLASPPNGVGEIAAFAFFPNTVSPTITSGTDITIGRLEVASLEAITFMFGARTLTFDNNQTGAQIILNGAGPSSGSLSFASPIQLNNNLTIINSRAASIQIGGSGVISGTGGIIYRGGGRLTLNPLTSNSYTGTTQILGRFSVSALDNVIALPSNLFLGSSSVFTVQSGNNIFNPSININSFFSRINLGGLASVEETISQLILDGGALAEINPSRLNLNTSTGIVIGREAIVGISAIGLQSGGRIINNPDTGRGFFDGSISASNLLTIDLGGSTALLPARVSAFDQGFSDFDLSFTNVQFTNGFLSKREDGTVAFKNVTLAEGLSIDLGTVVMGFASNDTFASGGAITINLATLNGFGIVNSDVMNISGVVGPGHQDTIGTLTFGGNYTQTANAQLAIKVSSGSNYDQLLVNGAVNLNGNLLIDVLSEGTLTAGDNLLILDNTAGGVPLAGQFTTVQSNLPEGLKANVIYGTQTVTLAIVALDCPICPPCPPCPPCPSPSNKRPNPPRDLQAKQINDRCSLDVINVLAWKKSLSSNVAFYRVYRDGRAIGGVSADAKLVFEDHLQQKNKTHRYSVRAISTAGKESQPVRLTFPKCSCSDDLYNLTLP